MTFGVTLILIFAAVILLAMVRYRPKDEELLWDWDSINTDELMNYPLSPNFLWGTATAAHQVEGGITNNNWTWWKTNAIKTVIRVFTTVKK